MSDRKWEWRETSEELLRITEDGRVQVPYETLLETIKKARSYLEFSTNDRQINDDLVYRKPLSTIARLRSEADLLEEKNGFIREVDQFIKILESLTKPK